MNKLFQVNNKTIYDIDTTILYTSSFNYTNDAIFYLNNNCVVITKDGGNTSYNVSDNLFAAFREETLKNKTLLTKLDELKLNILSNLNLNKQIFVFFNVLTY